MKYYEVVIENENIEPVIMKLAEMDIFEYQIEDPADLREIIDNKDEYDWDFIDEDLVGMELSAVPKIKIFFQDKEQAENVVGAFHRSAVNTLHDEDWKDKYKEHFRSLKLTENLTVCPSWEECADVEGTVISLDPGMAFGTGDHATTSMCAMLMERYGCKAKRVLDVGTGSGILAIAAAKMGAEDILGIDIDDTAVRVARENVIKNRCSDIVRICSGDLAQGIDFKADMVVANIVAELVIELAKDVKAHLEPMGAFIASGILAEKNELVVSFLLDMGFEIDDIEIQDGWCAIGAHYA